jgi:pimeloyl-ACP methyl ester carboxylesterase
VDTIRAMTIVRAGDIELGVERGGSGPPLLLIMGMSGTSLHWGEPFMRELRRDFDVIAYDHRGVGDSTRLEGAVTIAQLAQDASALLSALDVDAAHVLGISMGGMVAQELALAHPEQVLTLGLGCTYCGGPQATLTDPALMAGLTAAIMSGDRALALRAGWEINVSPEFARDESAYAEYLDIASRRRVAIPVVMAQLQACGAHDTSDRLGDLAMPTLVVHGTEDQLLPVANGRMIASLVPGSRLEIFDGAGHLFFWERPERSAELVREHAGAPA